MLSSQKCNVTNHGFALMESFLQVQNSRTFSMLETLPANINNNKIWMLHTSKLSPEVETSGSGTTSLAWTYIKYVDTVTVFAKNWIKGHWPLDDLWPHIFWGLTCDSTQGSLCPSPMKIHQSMWIQWLFCKNLKQRSLTPRWPLTPHLLRSHVWLYPRIIVSKSYENTLKYVDTVTLFAKTWTKGHWPLDDLWPHICWGHMCDSTQGSLCPSPMKIHQSMWIIIIIGRLRSRRSQIFSNHFGFEPSQL